MIQEIPFLVKFWGGLHPLLSFCDVATIWQVLVAAGWVVSPLRRPDVFKCCWASPTGGTAAQVAFAYISRVQHVHMWRQPNTETGEMQGNGVSFLCLSTQRSLNTTEVFTVRLISDQGRWGQEQQDRGLSNKRSIMQTNLSENIYI